MTEIGAMTTWAVTAVGANYSCDGISPSTSEECMVKRLGILAAVVASCALAACTNPTAPAAAPTASHGGSTLTPAGGVMIGGDT
jgi:hypothetical protein